MSDDPIKDLEDFNQQGLNVNPLPPSEVRRLGDRMRRRNAAFAAVAAAAAIAVIVTPLAVFAGGRDHAEPPVTPSVSQTPTSGTTTSVPVSRIPADFPLAAGWGDVGDLSSDYEFAPPSIDNQAQIPGGLLEACDRTPDGGDPVDRLTTKLSSPVTMYSREVQLFADDQEAAAYAASIRSVFDRCPTPNPVVNIEVVDSDRGDESFVVTQGGESASPAVALIVIRVGDAVLVDYAVEEGNDPGALATVALGKLTAPLDALNTLVHGTSGEPPPTDPPADGADIPADFPIDADLPDLTGDGGEITDPSAGEEGLGSVTLCGTDIWPVPPNDRLAVTSTGPEYRQSREVVTFLDAEAAVNVMTRLRQQVRACPSQPGATGGDGSPTNRLYRIHDADTGYDSLTFSSTLEDGSLGGGIYQFIRVGKGVLALYVGGEWANDTLDAGVAELTESSAKVTPVMCAFIEAGC